jgi:hypothetical protein
MTRVEVPEEFRRLGYSGEFWLDIDVPADIPEEPPCLLNASGWMLLSRSGTRGTIVRRDENAIVDLVRPL